MHRFFAIAKYLPVAVSGLLAVAWLVSLFAGISYSYRSGTDEVMLQLYDGNLSYYFMRTPRGWVGFEMDWAMMDPHRQYVGSFQAYTSYNEPRTSVNFRQTLWIPIPFLLTLLLPFTVAPFIRFRFGLWIWFGYVGLLGAVLAYYLA
ncbi:hypothetical protein NA78x_005926 [Anatilimnocola sp. NA78]|uniref:hypothetical protein n=1 Tax=Anatilimnocola sp. NA78 TaxID=3415683 RepID=UPI003CE478D2